MLEFQNELQLCLHDKFLRELLIFFLFHKYILKHVLKGTYTKMKRFLLASSSCGEDRKSAIGTN